MRAVIAKGEITIVAENLGDVEILKRNSPIDCFLEQCTIRRYTAKTIESESTQQAFRTLYERFTYEP